VKSYNPKKCELTDSEIADLLRRAGFFDLLFDRPALLGALAVLNDMYQSDTNGSQTRRWRTRGKRMERNQKLAHPRSADPVRATLGESEGSYNWFMDPLNAICSLHYPLPRRRARSKVRPC